MVRVPAGRYALRGSPPVDLPEYWIDKYEVTNHQFKQFMDQGGYRRPEYWKQPFVENGIRLSWDQAMHKFLDATGRPGPSTWELGAYPEGEADFPVSGVSWFEAAAYAEFAGRALPAVQAWFNAAGTVFFPTSSSSAILTARARREWGATKESGRMERTIWRAMSKSGAGIRWGRIVIFWAALGASRITCLWTRMPDLHSIDPPPTAFVA
jgi:formylglycine-generating enzyme required for sulfatase activity